MINGYTIHFKVNVMIDPKSISWLNINAFGTYRYREDIRLKVNKNI